jgi:hypothetical protein
MLFQEVRVKIWTVEANGLLSNTPFGKKASLLGIRFSNIQASVDILNNNAMVKKS